MIVLGNAKQAKSCAEPEEDVPFTPEVCTGRGLRSAAGSPGVAARGVPHPGCRRQSSAMAPVKVEEENVNSDNNSSSSSSNKRDETG